ncbi:MAG TPA: response regulator [Gemmatimonadales bacterium]|nr:response regulator [Gemmatimonadales bacterium]
MSTPAPVVLLAEDEPQMRRFLRNALGASEYELLEVGTAREALAQAAARRPDLLLLDLGLPDGDGLDVTRQIREWSRMPIIVLSARGREDDKVAALDAGADDYLTKPFGVGELLARMRVALRHAGEPASGGEPIVRAGWLEVDLPERVVRVEGREVHLTRTEYKLLAELARHSGKVLTHRHLLREVWGINAINQTHYLRVYMTQLRHKIERDPTRPGLLLTEPGVGYRLHTER